MAWGGEEEKASLSEETARREEKDPLIDQG